MKNLLIIIATIGVVTLIGCQDSFNEEIAPPSPISDLQNSENEKINKANARLLESVQGTVFYTIPGTGTYKFSGVTVKWKGTTIGTTTDFEGRYILDLVDGHDTLLYSHVGYLDQSVPRLNRNFIDVTMVDEW